MRPLKWLQLLGNRIYEHATADSQDRLNSSEPLVFTGCDHVQWRRLPPSFAHVCFVMASVTRRLRLRAPSLAFCDGRLRALLMALDPAESAESAE